MTGFIISSTFVLWVLFLALMALKERAIKDQWPKLAVMILKLLFIFGVIYDVVYNTVVGSILFLEFPTRLETFTSRLKRHYHSVSWRGALARWICDKLIHPIDKGHCE